MTDLIPAQLPSPEAKAAAPAPEEPPAAPPAPPVPVDLVPVGEAHPPMVDWLVQLLDADGTWVSSGAPHPTAESALARLAYLRQRYPEGSYRLTQRDTAFTVVEVKEPPGA